MPVPPAANPVAVAGPPLSPRLVLLLAFACGAAVANLYYVQPLLNVVGEAFDVSEGHAGLLVTCAQAGYLLGLAFLGPLGDLVERRRLVTVLLVCAAGAAAACAAAPSASALGAALVAVGVTSVVAMILIPLAATLAGPEHRGQVIGTVMSGLLVGILLSRTLSGLVAEVGGWRLVFALAAVGMLVLAFALRRGLPRVASAEQLRYPDLLRSVLALVASEPVLRQRMALGALAFGGFAVLWTSIAFMLAKPPYGYGEGVIGLFGLAGLAGAFAAPVVGRLADRGRDRSSLAVLLVATLASTRATARVGLGRQAVGDVQAGCERCRGRRADLARGREAALVAGRARLEHRDDGGGRREPGERHERQHARARQAHRPPVQPDVLSDELVLRHAAQRRGEVGDAVAKPRLAQREVLRGPGPAQVDPQGLALEPPAQRPGDGGVVAEVAARVVPFELAAGQHDVAVATRAVRAPPRRLLLHPRRCRGLGPGQQDERARRCQPGLDRAPQLG